MAKEYLKMGLSNAPIGIFMIDKKGMFTYANPTFLKMIGYRKKDIVGKTYQEIAPKIASPKNAKIISKRMKERLKTGKTINEAEIEMLNKKGKILPVVYSASGIKDDNGNITGEIVFLSDISKRKKAEKELEESEQRFKSFMKYLPNVAYIKDKNGKFLFVNDSVVNLVLKDRDQIIGKTDLDLWDRKTAKQLMDNDRRALNQNKAIKSLEDLYSPIDKTIHRFITYKFPILLDNKTKLLGGISIDITDQVRIEKELAGSEDRLKRLAESAQEGILFHDYKKVLDMNKAAADMLGLDISEWKGQSIYKYMTQDSKKISREMADKDSKEPYEIKIMKKGGEVLDFEVIGRSTYFNGKKARVVVIRDITERRKAEVSLKEKSDFLKTVIEENPYPMWVSDDKGTLIEVNKAALELFRVKKEEVLDKFNILEDPQMIEKGHLPLIKKAFSEGVTVNFIVDYKIVDVIKKLKISDRTARKIIDVTVYPILDDKGRVKNTIHIHRDITDKIKTEKALVKAQEDKARIADVERSRLEKELHDTVSQNIFTASLLSEVLPDLWEKDSKKAREQTNNIREITKEALSEIRMVLFQLHSAQFSKMSLANLLKQLVELLETKSEIAISLKTS